MSHVGQQGFEARAADPHPVQGETQLPRGLFDVNHAARYLCRSRRSIYRLVERGELPVRRDAFNRLRFRQSDLGHTTRLTRPAVTA